MENKQYRCVNGAFHDYECCDTCWNTHPDPDHRFGKMSSDEVLRVKRREWESEVRSEGLEAGFTDSQLKFLSDHFVAPYNFEEEDGKNNS